jgi:hypothetical protein
MGIHRLFPRRFPGFLRSIVEDALGLESTNKRSFNDILRILKQHNFQIMAGVDSAEVSALVDVIESWENSEARWRG